MSVLSTSAPHTFPIQARSGNKTVHIEPKSDHNPITRDWTDGLLSNIFREVNKPTDKNERKYILFDGDVDTLWVESMNSVMDDNKLLTLANGERIRLQKHCALLVEVGQCGV